MFREDNNDISEQLLQFQVFIDKSKLYSSFDTSTPVSKEAQYSVIPIKDFSFKGSEIRPIKFIRLRTNQSQSQIQQTKTTTSQAQYIKNLKVQKQRLIKFDEDYEDAQMQTTFYRTKQNKSSINNYKQQTLLNEFSDQILSQSRMKQISTLPKYIQEISKLPSNNNSSMKIPSILNKTKYPQLVNREQLLESSPLKQNKWMYQNNRLNQTTERLPKVMRNDINFNNIKSYTYNTQPHIDNSNSHSRNKINRSNQNGSLTKRKNGSQLFLLKTQQSNLQNVSFNSILHSFQKELQDQTSIDRAPKVSKVSQLKTTKIELTDRNQENGLTQIKRFMHRKLLESKQRQRKQQQQTAQTVISDYPSIDEGNSAHLNTLRLDMNFLNTMNNSQGSPRQTSTTRLQMSSNRSVSQSRLASIKAKKHNSEQKHWYNNGVNIVNRFNLRNQAIRQFLNNKHIAL